jgi:hypothetical protein
MEPMRWLYMHSKGGHLFFYLGTEEGKEGRVFVDGIYFIFVFSSCSQRVPACSQWCFSISQCVPQSTTHSSHITHLSNTYHSNFAASTLIILFSEMLKFSDFFFFWKNKILWRKIWNLQEYFICWNENFQILINYLTNMSPKLPRYYSNYFWNFHFNK